MIGRHNKHIISSAITVKVEVNLAEKNTDMFPQCISDFYCIEFRPITSIIETLKVYKIVLLSKPLD